MARTVSRSHARKFIYNSLNEIKNPIDSFSQYAELLANMEHVLNDIGQWFKQRLGQAELNELLELVDSNAVHFEKDKWYNREHKMVSTQVSDEVQ